MASLRFTPLADTNLCIAIAVTISACISDSIVSARQSVVESRRPCTPFSPQPTTTLGNFQSNLLSFMIATSHSFPSEGGRQLFLLLWGRWAIETRSPQVYAGLLLRDAKSCEASKFTASSSHQVRTISSFSILFLVRRSLLPFPTS